MRIVLDLQACQTAGSKSRGIGIYSWSLAEAMMRSERGHDFIVAVNENFAPEAKSLRKRISALFPSVSFVTWLGPKPTDGTNPENDLRRRIAEHLRHTAIDSVSADFCHISSLFEGLVDDAIVSCDPRPQTPTGVTLYDVIPLQYSEIYLTDRAARDWYFRKVGALTNCKRAYCISENTRVEAVRGLGLGEGTAVNISSAIDVDFRPVTYSGDEVRRIKGAYGITQPFVLYTGGIDHRKNVDGLVTAFGGLRPEVRDCHQLVIVCKIDDATKDWLWDIGERVGLRRDQLVLTGFVPQEDLVALYNLADLFVFPSWHEGFGLPALEAMACGTPTVAANNSSLPEVVGLDEALFDPHSIDSITSKIDQALTDDQFRSRLKLHSLKQASKFSWDSSAERLLGDLEAWYAERNDSTGRDNRERIALVTPFPPDASGIADYAAKLAQALDTVADVTIVVQDDSEALAGTVPDYLSGIVSQSAFRNAADAFDYVVYQVGNSPFHTTMQDLLAEIPGVVDMHDFFLGHMHRHFDVTEGHVGHWSRQLYASHGYSALDALMEQGILGSVVDEYPANWPILRDADGVIVHSEYARRLILEWYPLWSETDSASEVIPLPVSASPDTRTKTEKLPAGRWIGSFGLINREKGYERLLRTFAKSKVRQDGVGLALIGQPIDTAYAEKLKDLAVELGIGSEQLLMTGRVSDEDYRAWLEHVIGTVQLRLATRGETSAAVLDCLATGKPLVVNALGSAAELPADLVIMLPADFTDDELVAAFDKLSGDIARENGTKARAWLLETSEIEVVAQKYLDALRTFRARSPASLRNWALARISNDEALGYRLADPDVAQLVARAIAKSFPDRRGLKQYFVDVTVLTITDARSGIQRVVRSVLKHLLAKGIEGYRVEPVYSDGSGRYLYAREFTSKFLGLPAAPEVDAEIEFGEGDIFLGLDLVAHLIPAMEKWFEEMRNAGVRVQFVVYDMLPAIHPTWFADDLVGHMQAWYKSIGRLASDILAISNTVASEFRDWMDVVQVERAVPLRISSFPLGHDLAGSMPTTGKSVQFERAIEELGAVPVFLMVGTVEPRKGHADALNAFESIWKNGESAALVIIGKQGWRIEEFAMKIRSHPEFGRLLHWFDTASDEELSLAYEKADVLLAASRGEGYGLPLIEAASHGLPIIARDIPVFREVAGDNPTYFDPHDPAKFVEVLQSTINQIREGSAPAVISIPGHSWRDATDVLVQESLSQSNGIRWMPGDRYAISANDPRIHSNVDSSGRKYLSTAGRSGFLLYGPYLKLHAGRYRVSLTGTCLRPGDCWIDVATEGGERVHCRIQLSEAILALENGKLFDYNIDLAKPTEDLEVRCWVDGESAIRIDSLLIERVSGTNFPMER